MLRKGQAMAGGGWTRCCGLAALAGGALIMLFYAALVVRQVFDWQAGPTLGTPIHLPLMRTITTALALLIVGLVGLLAAQIGWLSRMARVGGLLMLSGFGLWAYAAAENFLPMPQPAWWQQALFPTLVALGSLLFGLSIFRSDGVPKGVGVLIGPFGLLGMALLATVEHPLFRVAGFLVMLAYGGGWVWLGYRLWRPTAAG